MLYNGSILTLEQIQTDYINRMVTTDESFT